MKAAIGILLIIMIGLAWRLYIEIGESASLRQELATVSDQLTNKSKIENLQLQAQCEAQAAKVFHRLGYSENAQGLASDTYQSHYNSALGKCFVAIESDKTSTSPVQQTTSRILLDAFEQREYA